MNQTSEINNAKGVIKIARWKNTRFWGVWLDQELIVVVVYKKGAMAVKELILTWQ